MPQGKEMVQECMQNWGYMTVTVDDAAKIDENLEYWGERGWELVSVIHDRFNPEGAVGEPGERQTWLMFFKKPRS